MTKPLYILLLIVFCGCGWESEHEKRMQDLLHEHERLRKHIDSLRIEIDKQFEVLDSLEKNMKFKLRND